MQLSTQKYNRLSKGIEVGVDTVEFAELGTDLVAGLVETDFLAYSAIFSDPSGNVGRKDESSDDYLRKTEVALDKTALLLLGLLRLLSIEAPGARHDVGGVVTN